MLLFGCAGVLALLAVSFAILVVVRAARLGAAGDGAAAPEGAPTHATDELPPRGYREPLGCFAFDPGDDWKLVEETSLRAVFSADPANPLRHEPDPGEAGLWVEARCALLSKVGSRWMPSIPGVSRLEDRRVPFGGGSGRLIVRRYQLPNVPRVLEVEYGVDRQGARCGLTVQGSVDAVERFRPELERAAASFVCAGR